MVQASGSAGFQRGGFSGGSGSDGFDGLDGSFSGPFSSAGFELRREDVTTYSRKWLAQTVYETKVLTLTNGWLCLIGSRLGLGLGLVLIVSNTVTPNYFLE